ncbi:MAG: SDR family oxidoreductase, partial [Alphaproteobacteria bacterium]|nr:SDR family oxidoreductase [Alphaproteobacteria bacterium]
MPFQNKTAVITGAASGIGAATAKLLIERGARVALVDRDGERLERVMSDLSSVGDSVKSVIADVGRSGPETEVITAVHAEWGRIDHLVTCAGVSSGGGTVLTLDEAHWDRIWQINVMGTVRWVKAVLPKMIADGGGSIVTIASQLAFNSGGNSCAYITSKGAIVSFTKTTAVDFAKDGIRINTVAPAVIDTPMSRASADKAVDPEAMRAWRLSRHPMGRIGHVDEVARTIAFLASDDASFTTGS